MTTHTWLRDTEQHFKSSGITTARLDALVLLSDELGQDKSWVLAHPEHILQIEQLEKLSTKVVQRAKHIPLAYIRGHAEFYGRKFVVNTHVLVPRPESESMIELLNGLGLDGKQATIIDVGTGSGCLAVTAKLEFPAAHVYAIDVDQNCLRVTTKNATKLGADIIISQSNLLDSLPSSAFDRQPLVILANLPYVPAEYPINEAARHEPKLALFSGPDGLDHYRQLFAEAKLLTAIPEFIITESLTSQHDELTCIAQRHGFVLTSQLGLAQLFTSP